MLTVQKRVHPVPAARSEDRSFGKLIIPSREGYLLLPLSEIELLEADGNLTRIHLANGKKYLVCKTLKVVAEKVNEDFYRIHSAYVINLRFLREVRKATSEAVLDSEKALPIARSRKQGFVQLIKSRSC